MEITTGAQLQTLTDGFRIRLLASLGRRPGSAKELAARFDVPTTRLYHHLDMLEEQGFIEIVATRRSGARTERCYGVPPWASMRPGRALLEADDRSELATAMRALAELVGATLERAVLDGMLDLPAVGADTGRDVVSWSTVRLTEEQRRGFSDELVALIGRIVQAAVDNEETDEETTAMTVYFALAPDPLAPTD
jgi:predicted DNA-binding transcriptional regulator YafY